MVERCAVCGQPLPRGLTAAEMHRRLNTFAARASDRAVAKARRELQGRFRSQLSDKAAVIQRRARREAEKASLKQLTSMRQRLKAAEHSTQRAVSKAVKDTEASSRTQVAVLQREVEAARKSSDRAANKAAKAAVAAVARTSRRELDLANERLAKERAQHAADTARLKTKVDDLSLKLERQTSEQMGEMTEADALAALKRAFPRDDIQRIERGVRGADILHKVIHDGNEAGRIVYECKNTATWQNEWLTKARGYRSEYQTQWVVIASRCFPRREKWFVVEKGVPIIELRLIVRLAEVLRGAVIEIGSLRLTTVGRQVKAAQMFEYVLGDHFSSRFKSIGEAVSALRGQQDREKQWHTEAWAKQVRLFDEMEGSRREIAAQVRAIAEAPATPDLRVIAARA